MFLKIMTGPIVDAAKQHVPLPESQPHFIVADITSCAFDRQADGTTTAICYVREPVKTAEVAGFCENRKDIDITGPAYLMNENGKTISTYLPDLNPSDGRVRVYFNDWENAIDGSITTVAALYEALRVPEGQLLFCISEYGAEPLHYDATGKVMPVNGSRYMACDLSSVGGITGNLAVTAHGVGAVTNLGNFGGNSAEPTEEALRRLPYELAAAIRRLTVKPDGVKWPAGIDAHRLTSPKRSIDNRLRSTPAKMLRPPPYRTTEDRLFGIKARWPRFWWWRRGVTREVILTRHHAIKLPSLYGWTNFLQGLLANMQERTFAAAGWPELCPITFSIPGGWIVIMRRADHLTDEQWAAFDVQAFLEHPNYRVPAETKSDSFGWIDGRIVATDYGS